MLKNKLSNRQKAVPRFVLNTLKGKTLKRSINWFKYDWNVLRTAERNFTAPVLVASITDACNLRCSTCLYLLEDEDYMSNNFMSFDMFRTVIDRYASRSEILFLTGGEPLLHKEFNSFVQYAKNKGLTVKTSTNGLMLNSHWQYFRGGYIDEINVSIDSWDYDSFNRYRGGTEKQYKQLVQGLRMLNILEVNYSMSFLLSTDNAWAVMNMLEFAEKYNPKTVHFHNINPHGCEQVKPLMADSKELADIELMKEYKDYSFDIVISHIFDDNLEEFNEKQCVQPWYYYCWDHNGCLAPCCHLAHDSKYGDTKFEENIFRSILIENIRPLSCKYCHRRFLGDNYAVFKSNKKRWYR